METNKMANKKNYIIAVLFILSSFILTPSSVADTGPEIAFEADSSMVETFFKSYDNDFKQYGYHIFRGGGLNTVFSPGADYVVGPGDKIAIKLWGDSLSDLIVKPSTNFIEHKMKVNEKGGVVFPEIGELNVSGMTMAALDAVVETKYKAFCTDCKVSVTIVNPRNIPILVSGKVKKPGYIMITAGESVFDVLVKVGGITKSGSLRNIELRKADGSREIIDLYGFISTGNLSKFPRIHYRDTIHVNALGPVVLIKGRITQPGIYELKQGESIGPLINIAGGVLPDANMDHVEITRFSEKGRSMINVSVKSDPIALKHGDIVHLLKNDVEFKNRVTIFGKVKAPKSYAFYEGMGIGDIITDIDMFSPGASLEYAEISRFNKKTLEAEILSFRPSEFLFSKPDKNSMVHLKPEDSIRVFSKQAILNRPMVTISGSVKKPGKFKWIENLTLKALINKAGGLLPEASDEIKVFSYKYENDKWSTSMVTRHFLSIDSESISDPKLKPLDKIIVTRQNDFSITGWQVFIDGEVAHPGYYPIGSETRLADVIEQAGFVTDNGDLTSINICRKGTQKIHKHYAEQLTGMLQQDLARQSSVLKSGYLNEEERLEKKQSIALIQGYIQSLKANENKGRIILSSGDLASYETLKKSASNIVLKPNDMISIKQKTEIITVAGEVFAPASYIDRKGNSVQYYLDSAGGVTGEGDIKKAFIKRRNGTVISYTQKKNGFNNEIILPGDVIVVPSGGLTKVH